MNYLKILVSLPVLLLAGCSSDDNDGGCFSSVVRGQPLPPAPPPQPVPPAQPFVNPALIPAAPADCGCDNNDDLERAKRESLRTYAEEEAARRNRWANPQPDRQAGQQAGQQPNSIVNPVVSPNAAAAQPRWKPSEGNLVQAGALVMALKKSKGDVNPTREEMIAELQGKMQVTRTQAEKILDKLGV